MRSHCYILYIFIFAFLVSGCKSYNEKPDVSSDQYKTAVSSFYQALGAIQSDRALFAIKKMNEVADLFPREPAVRANLGVFAMRQGNFEQAGEHFEEASEMAPENADIYFLRGILESRKGEIGTAVNLLKKASELAPDNVQILYALLSELERQNAREQSSVIRELIERLSTLEHNNLAVLFETVRISSKIGDSELLEVSLDQIDSLSVKWPEEISIRFSTLKKDLLSKPIDNLTFEIAYLRSNLDQLPEFQSDFNRIRLPENQIGFLITRFIWLPNVTSSLRQADKELTFQSDAIPGIEAGQQTIYPLYLSGDTGAELLTIRDGRAQLSGDRNFKLPFDLASKEIKRPQVTTIDFNYDFLNDIAFAGINGITIYQQNPDSTFSDVTTDLDLDPTILNRSYNGIWSADFDMDGDLDLLLSVSNGELRVLRNDGDDSFSRYSVFENVDSIVDFKWADMDADGDQDAIFLHSDGSIKLLLNERSGRFRRVNSIESLNRGNNIAAISVADINSDAYFEMVILSGDGVGRISYNQKNKKWVRDQIISYPDSLKETLMNADDLLIADFDNNGGLDLLFSGTGISRLWLQEQDRKFYLSDKILPSKIYGIADLSGDSRLDLIGLSKTGLPIRYINKGTLGYNGRIIRPRASSPVGDRRINSFGIGGEIEIRSGLLYQKQLITSPLVHFGLAEYDEAEMLRIIWPNGSVQTEFAELGYENEIFNEQMLKGSCPWIFTNNGEEIEFVTDFLWRSPLGLRINAQETAGVVQTADKVKIEGDKLASKNGIYDIRITAELWETHFFDHISLQVVDHPPGTEIYIDERFSIPPPDLGVRVTGPSQPVKMAIDQYGNDVTEIVSEIDGNYLDNIDHTRYQGLAKDHFVEIVFGDDFPSERNTVWLLAHGWIKPTDSSINLALSQGNTGTPQGIKIEVPDPNGDWKTVKKNIGFPAGKSKTVMIRLDEVFEHTDDKRIRLSTTTETYWDSFRWAVGLPKTEIRVRNIKPEKAILRFRGYSKWISQNASSPELPVYSEISGTTQRWRDLTGYYTRFGDVKELLHNVDDRYVIMNAGDELAFEFKSPGQPPNGWKRDFILSGDGWVKDGDYNTRYSKNVLPLPFHGMSEYKSNSGLIVDEPVFKKYPSDWVNYHTRYISPNSFHEAFIYK